MSSKRATGFLIWAVITLGAAWIGHGIQTSSLGGWIEQRTYDLRFAFRGSLPPSDDIPIKILAIDQATLAELTNPLMLWHVYFAPVVRALSENDAAVMGIDFIFSDITAFDIEGQTALSTALLQSSMPVVLASQALGDGRFDAPPPALLMPAQFAGHSIAFVNLTTDSDDFVRRQELIARAGGEMQPGFPLRIARFYSERTGNPVRVDVDESDPMIRINFRGPRYFERIPFVDAVKAANAGDDAFFQEHFAGKIVLVGRAGGRGTEDFHSTPQYYWPGQSDPSEPLRTPGIEIHANTILTLLEGNPIQEASSPVQWATTLGLAAAVALFCLWFSPAAAVTSSLGLIFAVILVSFSVLFPAEYWLPLVGPVSAGFVTLGTSEVANYMREGREKRYLRGAFKRYVSDAVIQGIIDSPEGLSLKGERKQVSILFADIRNFTSRSEGITAEALVQMLNKYFEHMVDAIQSNGGMIDKFIGDGLMALFGAPLDDPDNASHSVRAALTMLEHLEVVNRELADQGIEAIGIGVGIHTGEAVIGNIGSKERMEYTAIGDAVNTASRIESLTRKFDADILISADTYRALGEGFHTESLGSAEVKGKAQPVEIYKVVPNGHSAG